MAALSLPFSSETMSLKSGIEMPILASVPHHVTKTVFTKVTKRLYMAKSNGFLRPFPTWPFNPFFYVVYSLILQIRLAKRQSTALACWLSWLECPPVHRTVVGSIPSQGTYWVRGFDPQSRHIQEATNWHFSLTSVFLSLSLSLCVSLSHPTPSSLPISLKLMSISLGGD